MIDRALATKLETAATSVAVLTSAEPASVAEDIFKLRQHLERAARHLCGPATTAPRATLFDQLAAVVVYHRVSPVLVARLHRLRKRLNHIVHEDFAAATPDDVHDGARTILDLYAHVGVLPRPEPARPEVLANATDRAVLVVAPQLVVASPRESRTIDVESAPTLLPVVWQSWELTSLPEEDLTGIQRLAVIAAERRPADAGLTVICLHENDDNPIRVDLAPAWSTVELRPGSAICTHRLGRVARGHWTTTDQSLVVLEPDVLVQATDVAKSFAADTPSPLFALADIVTPRTTSHLMVLGTVANTLFDKLVGGDDGAAPSDLAREALDAHDIALAELAPEEEAKVRTSLMDEQMPALAVVATRLRDLQTSIEPTMMSASFGLQGRPDVIARRSARPPLVLDLKTGKPPGENTPPAHEALRSSTGVSAKDAAQLICYSLLLRSAGGGSDAELFVFYSRAIAEALRRSGTAPAIKELLKYGVRRVRSSPAAERAIIIARNEIVALELRFLAGGSGAPMATPRVPTGVPPYSRDGLAQASKYVELAVSPSSAEPDRHLGVLARHVFRTIWTERLGGSEARHGEGGFASLWLESSLKKKAESYSTLAYLEVEEENAGDRAGDVGFRFTNDDFRQTELREQDRIILFPHDGDRVSPLEGLLLRGEVSSIDTAGRDGTPRVAVRLYSTTARSVLKEHRFWAAQRDYSESLTRAPLAGVVSLMGQESRRVRLLMGLEKPTETPAPSVIVESGDALADVAARASVAEDYFLVQGPPGTGKTNQLLPKLVTALLAAGRGPVLALAFTNRAVGEMRNALRAAGIRVDPLYRYDRSPEVAAGETRSAGIRAELAATQMYCMTVASALGRLGWVKRMNFDTTVVDESSQLLDSHLLGILSLVRRFILIGDERQLPPVQAVRFHSDPGEVVAEIQFSTFERLLRTCEKAGWTHAFGMLKSQWRMHEEIQAFPSAAFYAGQLRVGQRPGQRSPKWSRLSEGPLHWTDALLQKRVTFVSVPIDERQKSRTHAFEAKVVARIATGLQERLQASADGDHQRASIGIIAPFRAQVAAIRRALDGAVDIDVDTVERFQGSQRDVIIISSTADDDAERLMTESLTSDGSVDRKFNVAITRPREHLIVVGHELTIASGRHSSAWLEHVRRHGVWLNAKDLGMDEDASA